MKILLDESELSEVRIEDILPKTEDKSAHKIKNENVGRPEGKTIEPLEREMMAVDAITMKQREVAELYGTSQRNVSNYENLKNMDDDSRARVQGIKYGIQDTVLSKLMETLDLFDPGNIEKETDKIKAAAQLGTVLHQLSGSDGKNGAPRVQVIFHSVKQRSLEEFQVIEVG